MVYYVYVIYIDINVMQKTIVDLYYISWDAIRVRYRIKFISADTWAWFMSYVDIGRKQI